jgi:hypothetical protein
VGGDGEAYGKGEAESVQLPENGCSFIPELKALGERWQSDPLQQAMGGSARGVITRQSRTNASIRLRSGSVVTMRRLSDHEPGQIPCCLS